MRLIMILFVLVIVPWQLQVGVDGCDAAAGAVALAVAVSGCYCCCLRDFKGELVLLVVTNKEFAEALLLSQFSMVCLSQAATLHHYLLSRERERERAGPAT